MATPLAEPPSEVDRSAPSVNLRIGAERRAGGSGGVHRHRHPATGQIDAEIPLAGAAEIADAVAAAEAAFQQWRRTRPAERRRLLLRLADLMSEHRGELARRTCVDNGTPITLAGGTIDQAIEWTRYYAGWADKIQGDTTAFVSKDGELGYTLPQPYGVIGVIITWNGPIVSLAMKVPAALAAGNTVVVKPSELTPFACDLYADLVEAAGFPPGVVNMVPGAPEAGAALVSHPLVKKVSFTGGSATARKILHACADSMKPSIMELGGKSANIVLDDANLDHACAHGTLMSVALLSGQGCSLATRMLVQRPVYDEVVERVAAAAAGIVLGDPFDPATISGPVISADAVNRILALIAQARADGSRLVVGGERCGGELADGFFVQPTVFADVDPQSELAQTEVFGPVLAITPFDSDDEAVEIANSTPFGLSARLQTASLPRANRIADALTSGEVLINGAGNLGVHRPFGGFGASGFGKEGGRQGIEEFLRIKAVGIL